MKKTKVLYFIPMFGTGGTEKVVLDLCTHIDNQKYDLEVCTFFPGKHDDSLKKMDKKRHILVKNVNLIDKNALVKIRDFIDRLHRLRRIILENQFDIIHTHHLGPLLHVFILRKCLGKEINWIHTEHNVPDLVRGYQFWPFKITKPLRGPDLITAVSRSVSKFIHCQYGIPQEKIYTVPNGVNIEYFSRACNSLQKRIELGLDLTDDVVGCVGNLRVEKNHQHVLRAFGLIAPQRPHLKLVLCGDGECRNTLEDLAKQLKVAKQVLFLGYRLDVAEIMSTFDVYCLPSKYEGMPISILEAWASEKPVVATDVTGIRDLIVNGENGVLVASDDPGKLAEGILTVLQNDGLRDKIRMKGSRLVSEKYSITKMVNSYERLYRLLR